jgi:hypothetical protein
MKPAAAGPKAPGKTGLHKKATYTLPPDVINAIDECWRFHKTLGSSLADSKSEYLADLVRRDSAKKAAATSKKRD